MKLFLLSLAVGVLATAGFLACKATIEAEAGPGVPIFGGSRAKVDIDGRSVSVPAGDPQPKAGDCVHINFVGPNGEDLGGADVTVDGPGVDAPDGTDSLTVSPCAPKSKDPKAKSSDQGQAERMVAEVYPFRWLPVDMMDGNGRFVDFTVTAADPDDARVQAIDFMRHVLIGKRPENVETFGFAYVQVQPDGRVRFTAVSEEKPIRYQLQWNGHQVATLRDATVRQTPSGWFVTFFTIPSALVDYSMPGFHTKNDAEYSMLAGSKVTSLKLALSVQP